MKEIIFNYFLSKVAQKEQELLDIRDVRVAQLAIIFSESRVFCRYPSGCDMVEVIGVFPGYAQELFLNLCLDAEKHGDHLLGIFDFKPNFFYYHGQGVSALIDDDIKKILEEKLYPKTENVDKTLALYKALVQNKSADFTSKIRTKILDVNLIEMTQLPEAEKAMMIDRAWERLTKNEHFINLLQPYGKYDLYGSSHAYAAYSQELEYLSARALAK